ncbi:DUF2306 domain-containing protein [Devosia sp.]|uniref:DUF2306 domain-containing protein n=1 Tax=Devosia sp. TaxID=1871048 RepID=UPI0032659BF9
MTTKSNWPIPTALILLTAVPAIAGIARLYGLAGGTAVSSENARFFAMPLPVVLHIIGATLFCILGAFQFSASFRRNHLLWHKISGRLLMVCGMVAALSGLWMNQFYPQPPGDGIVVYWERIIFGGAMAASIALSLSFILKRDIPNHRTWIIRGYAIGQGAGTQVFTHVPWLLLYGSAPGEFPRAILMGAGWVINIAIAEWIIRRKPKPRFRPLAIPA